MMINSADLFLKFMRTLIPNTATVLRFCAYAVAGLSETNIIIMFASIKICVSVILIHLWHAAKILLRMHIPAMWWVCLIQVILKSEIHLLKEKIFISPAFHL